MIGIILISHAHIATETKNAVEHILGEQGAFVTVDIPNSDVSCAERKHFEALLTSVNRGQGVLVMVDLFGATPCNIALEAAESNQVEVISGFNVPAVIKAITLRHKISSVYELAKISVESGQQYLQLTHRKHHLREENK